MASTGYRPASFADEASARLAMIEIAKNYRPAQVIREYVTNSLDADANNIRVVAVPELRRLSFTDDGEGMSYDKLESLRSSIGKSGKIGFVDKRGEKALGLLAFMSAGERMYVISRDRNTNGPYGILLMENKKNKYIGTDFSYIDEKETHGQFGIPQGFHGTHVSIDLINPVFMDKVYTIPNMRDSLTKTYIPALMNGMGIFVGKVTKRGKLEIERISTPQLAGDNLLDTKIEVEDKDDEGLPIILSLEAVLNFNPNGTNDKVNIFSKDVLVYNGVTDLDEFAKNKFWGCGKLNGFINDHFNKLILGRDGIDRARRQYRIWMESMMKIESQLGDIVYELIKRGPKEKEDRLFKEVSNALSSAIQEVETNYGHQLFISAGTSGRLRNVIGAPPYSKEGEEKEAPEESKEPKKRESRGTGGTFTEDKRGIERKVVPRERVVSFQIMPTKFLGSEAHLRARLDNILESNHIYVNSGHPNYKEREHDDTERQRYNVAVVSKVVAEANTVGELKQRIVSPEEAIKRAINLAEDIQYRMLSKLSIL